MMGINAVVFLVCSVTGMTLCKTLINSSPGNIVATMFTDFKIIYCEALTLVIKCSIAW